VPIQVRALRPGTLVLFQLSYKFYSLLSCIESLHTRGRRLNDTAVQRQGKVYADDVYIQVDAEDCGQRLHVKFVDERPLSLAQGERRLLSIWLSNTGVQDIEELWVVSGAEDELWVNADGEDSRLFNRRLSGQMLIIVLQNPQTIYNPKSYIQQTRSSLENHSLSP